MKWNRFQRAALGVMAVAALLAAEPGAASEDTLEVRELVLARGVADREPTGVTDVFTRGDGRVYAFARIGNSGAPATLFFVWRRGDKVHGVYTSTIGVSPGWRVWSYVSPQSGPWKVELVTESGKILAERGFYIE